VRRVDEIEVSASAALSHRALKVLPGGVSRNAVLRRPHPVYADRGAGCRVVDIEGVERIDFANNMASLIHGHAPPTVVEAVTAQLGRGTAFNLATEVEVRFAEHLAGRNPGFEMLRFVNSGTEAVMVALKAARAFTGRPMIAKVEGAYHGTYDYAEVSQTANPSNWGDLDEPSRVPAVRGTPAGVLDDVVVIPFNDPERSRAILDRHGDRVAAVLVDPMPHRVGLIPASAEFVDFLRAWTLESGALLVFDEVITFRSEYGGAQTWYRSRPDLTALGKIIGGGFPVGAVAGRRAVMEVLDPLATPVLFPHSGTFSANPVTMTAGLVTMELFDGPAVERLNRLAGLAVQGIEQAAAAAGVAASVTGGGSMLRVHLKEKAPSTYREAYASPAEAGRLSILLEHLFSAGILLIGTGTAALSTPMTEHEVGRLAEAMEAGFRSLDAS
jgi:glutamate-1-semialdehyde 2,1-aminomutase